MCFADANTASIIRQKLDYPDQFAGQNVFRGGIHEEEDPDSTDRKTLPAACDPKDEQYKRKDLFESRYGPALGVLDLLKDFAKSLKYDYFQNDACFKDLIVEKTESEELHGLHVTVEVLRSIDESSGDLIYYALLTRVQGDLLSYKNLVSKFRTALTEI